MLWTANTTLLAVHSNSLNSMHRFLDMAKNWSKITKFNVHHLYNFVAFVKVTPTASLSKCNFSYSCATVGKISTIGLA